MAFWNRTKEATSAELVQERNYGDDLFTLQGIISQTYSGSLVSDVTAQGIPSLSRAFNIRCDQIAGLPLVARNSLTLEALAEQPFLLTRPNPRQTRFDFMYEVESSLCWHGNAVVLLSGFDPKAQTFSVANVADMHFVGVNVDTETGEIIWNIGGVIWPTDQVLHIKGKHVKDQYVLAKSPIWTFRESLGEVQAQRQHAQRFWREGNVPPLIVKLLDDGLADQEGHTAQRAEEAAKVWNASSDGTSRRTRFVPPFVDVETLAQAEETKAWIESRELSLNDIACIAGIDPHWIGRLGEKAVYANLTDKIDSLFRLDLRGDLCRIEEAFASILPRGTTCKFDTSEMLRMNPQMQAETDSVNLASGALTQTELRRRDGREQITLEDLPIEEKRNWLVELVQAGADPDDVTAALGLPPISFPNLTVQVQPPAEAEPDPADPNEANEPPEPATPEAANA